jgi:hypothetical protein
MPTPSDPATGTAAVTLDAVPGDAVATGPEALPQAAVKPGTSTASQLCIAADNAPDPVLYCRQIFNMPANQVVVVPSWKAMMDEIFKYSRIDKLVVLTHGGLSPGEIYLGQAQRTLGQWAAGASSEDSIDPFTGLAAYQGSIGTLHLEGCSVGADPAALLSFKQRVPVGSVEAWSMGRYLDRYVYTASGNVAAVVQQLHASGDLVRASPYLPKGPLGGTYQATELESLLLRDSQFALFAEIFAKDSLPFGTQPFGDLVAMPSPPFVEGTHFARAEGLRDATIVRSAQEAAELQALIDRERPLLYRVIAR